MSHSLLTSVKLGAHTLKNRIIMAPMTRNRVSENRIPTALNATYYVQRAEAGLLITEATSISPQGVGAAYTPGIYTSEQIKGWQLVTDAMHAVNGKIFMQLWHVGAISHPDLQLNGELPVAPSAIKPQGETYTYDGPKTFLTPRALSIEEIPNIVSQFRQAALNAKIAGFDGVEIHGAYGYLLEQFLYDGSNKRDDKYGGSPENRARLILEVVAAVTEVLGNGNVGLRITPNSDRFGIIDSAREITYNTLIEKLNAYQLAYLHIVNATTEQLDIFRKKYLHTIIVNGGLDPDSAQKIINNKLADAAVFGQLFIANPDLPNRIKHNLPLAAADSTTFFVGGEKGYIDYEKSVNSY